MPPHYLFRHVSKDFMNDKISGISPKGIVYGFSSNYELTGIENIANVNKYLMGNIKRFYKSWIENICNTKFSKTITNKKSKVYIIK